MSVWEVTRYSKGFLHKTSCISIEMTYKNSWAVRCRSWCLNNKGKWEYEPMPSSRTDAFLKRCRFSTAKKAMTAADKAKEPL